MSKSKPALDSELLLPPTAGNDRDESFGSEILRLLMVSVVAIAYILVSNYFSNTITPEFFNIDRLIHSVFLLYPLVCVAFGLFLGIFKHKNLYYWQRALRSVLKLLSFFFTMAAVVYTLLYFSVLGDFRAFFF